MKNSTVLLLSFLLSTLFSVNSFAEAGYTDKYAKPTKSAAPVSSAIGHFETQYKLGRYPMSEKTYQKLQNNLSRNAFESFSITNGTSLPSEADYYEWQNNSWSLAEKETYRYNTSGSIIEVITKNPDGTNSDRMIISYNAANLPTVYKFQDWENGTWVEDLRDSLVYNNQNNITAYYSEMWMSNAWTTYFRGMYAYTYDNSNRMTSYTAEEYNGNTLVSKEKMLFTYTGAADFPTTETYQMWGNNQWVNDSLVTYTLNDQAQWIEVTGADWKDTAFVETERFTGLNWHNYENQELSAYKYQVKQQNNWLDIYRANTDYTRADSITTLYEDFRGNWIPTDRYTEFFNELQTFTGYRYEGFEDNNWSIIQEHKESHTYDAGNNIVETIYQSLNTETGRFENEEKAVYYYGSVTASKLPAAGAGLKLYPNPVVNDAIVQLELNTPAFVSMKVIDISGKVVEQISESALHAGSHQFQLNTTQLKAGVYHLQIVSSNAVSTQKFVVLK